MKTSMIGTVIFTLLFVSPVMAKTVIPNTPEQEMADRRFSALLYEGEALLQAGNPSAAEKDFRAALAIESENTGADPGLAEALAAQGKTREALQVYRSLIYQYPRNLSSAAQGVRTLMHFAILLNQTGKWAEAVAIYEKALPSVPDNGMIKINAHFDPAIPQPTALEAAAHIALGVDANWHGDYRGELDHDRAFQEYAKALLMEPNWAVANYYYGYGWKRLDPTARTKSATPTQVKAAFQKAVDLGEGEVKKAAEQELQGFK